MKRLSPQEYFDRVHTLLAAAQDRVHGAGQRYAQVLAYHSMQCGREADAMVLKDPALPVVVRDRMIAAGSLAQAERDFDEARSLLAERLVDLRVAAVGLAHHLAAAPEDA